MPTIAKLTALTFALALAAAACTGGESSPGSGDPGDTGGGGNDVPPPSDTPDAGPPPTDGDGGPSTQPPPANGHHRVGWIGAGDVSGQQDFAANASWFTAINPDSYRVSSSYAVNEYKGGPGAQVIAAAKQNGVALVPMVANVDNPAPVRDIIRDAGRRSRHVADLVALAVNKGYPGLDIDYEHLSDGDRANFTAFIRELASAMHAKGKIVSVAVQGAAADVGVYDYAALSAAADEIHIMGYDYHWVGSHLGPTSPLGWIEAVVARVSALPHPEKFILGLPGYGLAGGGSYCALSKCRSWCSSAIATSNTEMASCPFNTDTHFQAGRSLTCDGSHGRMYFDDLASLEEKVREAQAAGLGGVTMWTVGWEPSGYYEMVKKYF